MYKLINVLKTTPCRAGIHMCAHVCFVNNNELCVCAMNRTDFIEVGRSLILTFPGIEVCYKYGQSSKSFLPFQFFLLPKFVSD
jgi:hypothetical protein